MNVKDSIDELRAATECQCVPAYKERGLHHPNECFAWLRPDVELLACRFDALSDLRHPAVDRILLSEESSV